MYIGIQYEWHRQKLQKIYWLEKAVRLAGHSGHTFTAVLTLVNQSLLDTTSIKYLVENNQMVV